MTWDDVHFDATPAGRDEAIELVGTNLRLTGLISLGRFPRLTDLINSTSGYIRIREARLLRPDGGPTDLEVSELMVDQDEISFVAELNAKPHEPGSGSGSGDQGIDGSVAARQTRRFVVFTPGHAVSGTVYIFGETDLAAFVESTHPRYVPMVDVTTRSLADERTTNRYPFILMNRTQMIAAAEIDGGGQAGTVEGTPDR